MRRSRPPARPCPARCARGERAGFTLVEALVAIVILGFAALATASAEGWAARTTAGAEAREDAAALAELIADSLAQLPSPTSGAAMMDGMEVRWDVQRATASGPLTLRLRVRPLGRPLAGGRGEEEFGAVLGPPPPSLQDAP